MQQNTGQKEDNAIEIDLMRVLQNVLKIIKRLWLPM